MNLQLEITDRAAADRDKCFNYIEAQSPAGAIRWLDAFETAANSLPKGNQFGEAPESRDHAEIIRQKTFSTRSGLSYRLLYLQRRDTIFIIHVRGT